MSIINNVQHPPPVDQTWSTDRGIKVHDQHTNLTQSEYNSSSIYNMVQFIHSSTSRSVQGSCSSRAYAANLSLASVAADRRGLPWVGASAPAPPCSGSGVFGPVSGTESTSTPWSCCTGRSATSIGYRRCSGRRRVPSPPLEGTWRTAPRVCPSLPVMRLLTLASFQSARGWSSSSTRTMSPTEGGTASCFPP